MADKVPIRQFGAEHQLYVAQTTDQKEKKKSSRLAFLIISGSAHLAHLQSRRSQPANQNFAKEPNSYITQ